MRSITRFLLRSIVLATVLAMVQLPLASPLDRGTPARAAARQPVGDQLDSNIHAPRAMHQQTSSDDDPKNEALDESAWRAWQALPAETKRKVDPRLLAELRGEIIPAHLGGTADSSLVPPAEQKALQSTRFLVYLQATADLERMIADRVFASAAAQRAAVRNVLRSTAQSSQAVVASRLDAQQAAGDVAGYHSFYIVNALAVEGGLATIVDLASRSDVQRIVANYPMVPLWNEPGPQPAAAPDSPQRQDGVNTPNAIAWNLATVRANEVWSRLGVSGAGAVVAGFDTGVSFQHPALVAKYRGAQGGGAQRSFDHNYNWFEPDSSLYPDGNLGPSVSHEPRDCAFSTHGTHTMGTMVGGDPNSGELHTVGMAPNARWIAVPGICNNTMPGGLGDDIGGLKAFQWLLCPTDLSGDLTTADCAKAPDVVNNSWGSANPVDEVFRPAIQALRAAGIAPVFAAGNPYAGEGSIGAPGNAPEAITVGATTRSDEVAYFSGRGPSFYAGEQKPELSAPGVDVPSTVGNNSYAYYSGTSMAAPHVAGLVALMVAADLRDGVRDSSVDEIERLIADTAIDLGEPGADNAYGYGRIDAFAAVQAALSAGDLRGVVRDVASNQPISSTAVVGVNRATNHHFTTHGDARGVYSLTVPAGSYDLAVTAWGYYSATFANQTVFPGALSVTDLALAPRPVAAATGVVRTGAAEDGGSGGPVSGARVYAVDNPTAQTVTGPDGAYTLPLPVGVHQLAVDAPRHRVVTATVRVGESGATHNFSPAAAPAILLVDADAYNGWFFGWPVYTLFQLALDTARYPHDLWRIESIDITDTAEIDGIVRHGVPSAETLRQYDVVVWIHSGCGSFVCYQGSPRRSNAERVLQEYLDGGGRLILSGQDIAFLDDGRSVLFDDYLQADYVMDVAAEEGDSVVGRTFLADLEAEITNASLYGYPNGAIILAPDSVQPADGAGEVFPVLSYEDGGGAAALAVDPCRDAYRALYFAVGYENLGPRGEMRNPAFSTILDRGVQWLSGSRPQTGLSLEAVQAVQTAAPGQQLAFPVQLINIGIQPATAQLNLAGATWTTRIISGTLRPGEVATTRPDLTAQPVALAPCSTRTVTLLVDVPPTAQNGDVNVLTLTAASNNAPAVQTDIVARAFAPWRFETAMPSPRSRMGVAARPGSTRFYAIGGWSSPAFFDGTTYGQYPTAVNERFDACTNRWETMTPMPEDLANGATAVLDGQIYVLGGSSYGGTASDTVYVYDPAGDTWSQRRALPIPISGASAAAVNGQIYLFGGWSDGEESNRTFAYDPAADAWRERAPLPGGGRQNAAAAALNGVIYVVGGWPNSTAVEVYDPAADAWSTAASTRVGRQAPGLVTGPDGYLYLTGGGREWEGIAAVERYSPTTDTWQRISTLNDGNRAGSGAVYVAGRLYAVGGNNSLRNNESLRLDTSFCLSNKTTSTPITQPDRGVEYTVEVFADATAPVNPRVLDPLPAHTVFRGFEANPVGATYNADENRVEWRGTLPAGAPPVTFSYAVDLAEQEWRDGASITGTTSFASIAAGPPQRVIREFTRTVTSYVFQPDFAASSLTTDRDVALRGQTLTYRANLESRNAAGGAVALHDPLPDGLRYVPSSLRYENGFGAYEAETRAIHWTGRVEPDTGGYVNNSPDYAWVDSQGEWSASRDGARGAGPVEFEWIDILDSGTFATSGDEGYPCDLPIGFPFPFYGEEQSTFCASTNGFLSFDEFAFANFVNDCPLPGPYTNRGTIAAMWDDLVVEDGIYYQTFGTAPNRYLVVQWSDVRHYLSFDPASINFQLILAENGAITVQIREAGSENGISSTTGVADLSLARGTTYACNTADSLQDELAVLFVPPGGSIGRARSTVSFDVTVSDALPVNSEITNSVWITSARDSYTRSVTTALNPITLADSTMEVDGDQFNVGDPIAFRLVLRNTGLLTATAASFVHPLPAAITYTPHSVTCSSGVCRGHGSIIEWTGTLAPQRDVMLEYAALLSAPLPDRTSVSNAAQVYDGYGNVYTLQRDFVARSSDLSASLVRVVPAFVEPDARATFELFMRNTGAVDAPVTVKWTLPADVVYDTNSLVCGAGTCGYAQGVVDWAGTVPARGVIPLRFTVAVPPDAPYGQTFTPQIVLTDGNRNEDHVFNARLTVAHNHHFAIMMIPSRGVTLYLPVAAR